MHGFGGGFDSACRRRAEQRIEENRGTTGIAVDHRDLGIFRRAGAKRRSVAITIIGKNETRTHQLDNAAQPSKVAGNQGVGGRNRNEGHADMQTSQRQQSVFDAVAREDEDRPLGRKTTIEQSLPDRARRGEGFGVTDLPPAFAGACYQKRAIRRPRCPALQPLGHPRGIGPQLLRIADEETAVRTGFELGVPHMDGGNPCVHRRYSPVSKGRIGSPGSRWDTLAARFWRKSWIRVLASPSLAAIVNIKLSMRKPASESARAILGKA